MHTLFLSGDNLVSMTFTEEHVIAIQEDLVVFREHVYKLVLIGEHVAFHRIKQL